MNKFSHESAARLATCDQQLQDLFHAVLQIVDITILCGHRNKVDQDAAVASGNSRAPWPTSRHNSYPSEAVDVAPYPIDWNDIKRFEALSKIVLQEAGKLGIAVRWGGNFSHLKDYPHWELVK